jgi:hypothetical protein
MRHVVLAIAVAGVVLGLGGTVDAYHCRHGHSYRGHCYAYRYHGHYYRYRYNGRYYLHRSYRHGHWYYY